MRATTLLRFLASIQWLRVGKAEIGDDGIEVQVSPTWKIPRCGDCGTVCRSTYDRRLRRWRDKDLGGMMQYYCFKIRRVNCPRCGGIKTESVPWAAPGSAFTYAFEESVAFMAREMSKATVVRLMRIVWRTVGRIIARYVDRQSDPDSDGLDGLRSIGVDEISYRRHHKYITVVVNHATGKVVWSKEGKSAETLKCFFEALGSERCKLLESVTIDMSKAYIKAVKECAPQAMLIFDRFHVQRLVQDALNNTRRDEVRKAQTKRQKRGLKKTRNALLKSSWNLTDAESQTLDQLAETNEPLFRAHLLKESFVNILAGKQINVARRRLVDWISESKESGLKQFIRVAVTIEKHLDGILEYVRTRLNNGRTEGVNGKIRTITRRSYGFHSARALIAMIALCCGNITASPGHLRPVFTH